MVDGYVLRFNLDLVLQSLVLVMLVCMTVLVCILQQELKWGIVVCRSWLGVLQLYTDLVQDYDDFNVKSWKWYEVVGMMYMVCIRFHGL